MGVYKDLTELVGKTPLVELRGFSFKRGLACSLVAKVEFFNPAGSVKDRVALEIINDAEKRGVLNEGSVIIETTSGNTGIGIAAVAAVKGYKVILTMPESMSVERSMLLKAYGAEIVLTDKALGMAGAVQKAEELAKSIPGAFVAGQFSNQANVSAHRKTTGPEIWNDTDGKIDIFIAGVGTGGTITGAGEFLKEKNPDIKIVAAEPADSPLLSEGWAASHSIQGIGANFVPEILNRDIYDEIITVADQQAYDAAREIAGLDGLLVGISSGAAAHAAAVVASRPENAGKMTVVLLPDTGERYISTELFDCYRD